MTTGYFKILNGTFGDLFINHCIPDTSIDDCKSSQDYYPMGAVSSPRFRLPISEWGEMGVCRWKEGEESSMRDYCGKFLKRTNCPNDKCRWERNMMDCNSVQASPSASPSASDPKWKFCPQGGARSLPDINGNPVCILKRQHPCGPPLCLPRDIDTSGFPCPTGRTCNWMASRDGTPGWCEDGCVTFQTFYGDYYYEGDQPPPPPPPPTIISPGEIALIPSDATGTEVRIRVNDGSPLEPNFHQCYWTLSYQPGSLVPSVIQGPCIGKDASTLLKPQWLDPSIWKVNTPDIFMIGPGTCINPPIATPANPYPIRPTCEYSDKGMSLLQANPPAQPGTLDLWKCCYPKDPSILPVGCNDNSGETYVPSRSKMDRAMLQKWRM